jgi:ABC-type uncharacterized transport system auxiliary subunit
MRATPAALAAALLVAACAGGSKQAVRYYVLDAPAVSQPAVPATASPTAPRDATLLVAPTSAAPFYDTREIVFSRAAGTRGIYQYSRWTEPPGRGIAAMLVSRIEQTGAFRTTILATSGVKGSLLLRTHLVEMYHDASTSPGMARVTLMAELSDPGAGLLLSRRAFTAQAPAADYDADGAVQGLREALGTLVEEVATWASAVALPQ